MLLRASAPCPSRPGAWRHGQRPTPATSPPLSSAHSNAASHGPVACRSSQNGSGAPGSTLLNWLGEQGAPQTNVSISTIELPGSEGKPLDTVVASRPLAAGEVALRLPDHLVITLDRVFGSEFVAELLTTDKLSELACLSLFLMYEKKVGKASFWYPFIKELDRQRGRSPQAVESPLLWEAEELDRLLAGSPLLGAVRGRLAGIEKEYQELDTVWFMSGSMFKSYPYALPTEAFSFELFKQAFAAVQSSIVHLQGVPVSKRFALMPLGPPLVRYSSTSKAVIAYNPVAKAVELVTDRPLEPGQPLVAWCGPQPSSRLLLNYGIVDEMNPYDRLTLTVTIPNTEPALYQAKRAALAAKSLSTQQTFDVTAATPLPPLLLPYMRVACSSSAAALRDVRLEEGAPPGDAQLELLVMCQLMTYLKQRLAAYPQPLWRDLEVIADPAATPRQKVAARLTKMEKSLLQGCLDALKAAAAPVGGDDLCNDVAVKTMVGAATAQALVKLS